MPAGWSGSRRGVLLDPGAFGGALRVWVNGRRAAVPDRPGRVAAADLRLLHPGNNALRLEVATTLNNAMRTEGLAGDPDYASYSSSRPFSPPG